MSLARVFLPGLGDTVSALGFGCASLGSRIAPAEGASALARAYDAGVTWFDVAPSYGDGQAEELLGRFLKGRRGDAQVLTKVGIAPPAPSLKQRLARPAMRAALAAAPALRAAIRKRRPLSTKLPLDAAMIPASLDASLQRLGTDHVDVLALHDATPDEAARADVIEALARAKAAGKIRVAAIASSPEAAAAGIAVAPDVYGLAQMANNVLDPGLDRFAVADGAIDRVTHSVYGTDGSIARLATRIEGDRDIHAALAQAGYAGAASAVAADFLADYSFSANSGGVVLLSMFKAAHLAANVARHGRPRDAVAIRALADRIRPAMAR